jgi:hypothetical protein
MAATYDQFLHSLPASGLFAGKRWLFSPEPLPLDAKTVRQIDRLGYRLRKFQAAANAFYHRSIDGRLPGWIAATLDAGKPQELIDLARHPKNKAQLPGIIRPDLLLTEAGYRLTEIDSVPGGIGLTAWLAQTYSRLDARWQLLGGPTGMLDGFSSLFPKGADIAVSAEAGDYLPEMQWLVSQLSGRDFSIHEAESYRPRGRDVYRFFELFDLPQVRHWEPLLEAAMRGEFRIEAPMKPWLEEKAWLALFWNRSLREAWRRELRESQQQELEKVIPRGWIIDPTPVPHHAVIPGLEIQSWEELGNFSQKQRQYVLKLSGFSERAWGSRSVTVGHDVPQEQWRAAIREAEASAATSPWILQQFIPTTLVDHPYFDPADGSVKTMTGRVRLCPYYFCAPGTDAATLGGVLATIVPADKKIIHGMEDAILVPCRLA